MAKIGLLKGSGKRLKVREKSGNFEMDIEWQPCVLFDLILNVPSTIFQLNRDGSSCVESVLS